MKRDWKGGFAAAWFAAALSFAALAVAQTSTPLPLAKPEEVGMSSQRLAKITAALKKEADEGSFRGAVVMVARKGKLVYQDAVGMQSATKPMTKDAIFRIYSMTKPLASVAAMMLVEDGVIQLTDPVGKFLPGFDKMQVSVATKTPEGQSYNTVPAERAMPASMSFHSRSLMLPASFSAVTELTARPQNLRMWWLEEMPSETARRSRSAQLPATRAVHRGPCPSC